MPSIYPEVIAQCPSPKCNNPFGADYFYTWCSKCGEPLPESITGKLPKLQKLKAEASAARTEIIERNINNSKRTYPFLENRWIRLIRVKQNIIIFVVVVCFFAVVLYFFKKSEAYQFSERYIRNNSWVKQEVGSNIEFGFITTGRTSSSEGIFSFDVSGDQSEIRVHIRVRKDSGYWSVISAGYTGRDGGYRDITKPYGERSESTK